MADGLLVALDVGPFFQDLHDVVDGDARVFPEDGQVIQEVRRFLADFQAQVVCFGRSSLM